MQDDALSVIDSSASRFHYERGAWGSMQRFGGRFFVVTFSVKRPKSDG